LENLAHGRISLFNKYDYGFKSLIFQGSSFNAQKLFFTFCRWLIYQAIILSKFPKNFPKVVSGFSRFTELRSLAPLKFLSYLDIGLNLPTWLEPGNWIFFPENNHL